MNIAKKIEGQGGIFASFVLILAALFAFLAIPNGIAKAADPSGFVDDVVVNNDNSITVKGWAYDSDDTSKSIDIHVYIDSAGYNTGATDVVRNDVQKAFNLKTNIVGYNWTSPVLSNGDHTVTIWAINTGSGSNQAIYSRTMNFTSGTKVESGTKTYGAFAGGHKDFYGTYLTWLKYELSSVKFYVGGVRMSGTSYIGYCAGQYGPDTPIEDGNSSRAWGAPHVVTSWHGSIRWIGDKGTHSGSDIDHLAYIVNEFGVQPSQSKATTKAIDNYLDILNLWTEEISMAPDMQTISDMWWVSAEQNRGPYTFTPTIKEVNPGMDDGKYTLQSNLLSTKSSTGHSGQENYTAKIYTTGDLVMAWDDTDKSSTSRSTGTDGDINDLRFHYVSGQGTFFVTVEFPDLPDSKLYVSNSPLSSTWYHNAKVIGYNYGQDMFVTSRIRMAKNSNTLEYDIPTYDASGSTEVCVGNAATCDPTKETDSSGNDLWTTSARARTGDTYYWRVSAKNLSTDKRSTIAISSNESKCSKNYANTSGTTTTSDAISPNESTYTTCGPFTFSGTTVTNSSTITTYAKILNSTDGANVGNTTYAKSTTTTNTATVAPHTFKASITVQVCKTGTTCTADSDTGWVSSASFKKGTSYLVRVKASNTSSTAPILGMKVSVSTADGYLTSMVNSYTIDSLASGATDVKTFTSTATFPGVSDTTYTHSASYTTPAASGSLSGSGKATVNRIYVYGLSVTKYVCKPGNNCETGGTTGWATSATYPYGNTKQIFKYVITNKSDNNITGISVADSTVSAGTTSLTDTTLAPGATKTVTFTNTSKLTSPYTSETTATLINVSGVSASASASVSVSKTYDVSITKQVCVGDATACPTGTASKWSSSVSAKRGETISWKTVVKYTGNYDPVDLVVSDTGNASCSKTTSGPISAGTSVTITCTEAVSYDSKTAAATVKVADRNNSSATLNTASASATVTRLLQAGYKLSTKACVPDSGRDCSATSAETNWKAAVEAFAGNAVKWKVSATNSGELALKNLSVNSLLNNASSSNLTSCNISNGTLAVGGSKTNVCNTTLGTSNQNVKSTASTDISN